MVCSAARMTTQIPIHSALVTLPWVRFLRVEVVGGRPNSALPSWSGQHGTKFGELCKNSIYQHVSSLGEFREDGGNSSPTHLGSLADRGRLTPASRLRSRLLKSLQWVSENDTLGQAKWCIWVARREVTRPTAT